MNYLVTGAAGFIGFYTAKKLLEEGHKVLGIDSINDYYDPALKFDRLKELGLADYSEGYASGEAGVTSAKYPNFNFVRMEIENEEKLFQLTELYTKENGPFDRIIHLAAQAGVRYSLENPHAYTKSNIDGFLSILELSRKTKVPHLVYASSSSVYGLNTKQPFSIHDEVSRPASLYAATKRSNELMAHTYSHLFGLAVTGLRFFTVYGPLGRPDMAYFKFANSIMKDEPIEVYNNGDMYRDFTYIDDICAGILAAADHIPSEKFALYNLGNNHPEKLLVFIETLEKVLGKTAVKKYLPMQAGDVYSTAADIEDTKRDLGWEPHTNIEEGLKLFAEWFRGYSC